MYLTRRFFAMLLTSISVVVHAALPVPQSGAGATEIVKFVVGYEQRSDDASELLRGTSRSPTKLEDSLFTRDFLTAWYDLKAREAANPDAFSVPNSTPGIDNVTNGEDDYLIGGDLGGNCSKKDSFKDVSSNINGSVVAILHCTDDRYSALFFLKKEGGRLKIDDVLQRAFSSSKLDPATPHHPLVSEGIRKDVEAKLKQFKELKR